MQQPFANATEIAKKKAIWQLFPFRIFYKISGAKSINRFIFKGDISYPYR